MSTIQQQSTWMPNAPKPSTDKQRDYIKSLAADRSIDESQAAFIASDAFSKITMQQASRIIGELQKLPRVNNNAPRDTKSEALPDVPEGRYAVEIDGVLKFYVIDKPTDGRWAGFTFVAVQASDDKYPIKSFASKLAILKLIAVNPREASERYGKELGACGICGRTLTDEESRANGIGPICAAKMGWS